MAVAVHPDRFTLVDFDHDEILAVAERVAAEVGLAEHPIVVTVEERTPLSRIRVTSLDPIEVAVDGGAFEDLRRIRQLDPARVAVGLGLQLIQAADRLDPAFGGPPLGADLSLAHRAAWDAYALGRLDRLGHPAQRQRRLFHFRNRHGFTDAADRAFDRLWTASGLTWAAVTAVSDSVERPAA